MVKVRIALVAVAISCLCASAAVFLQPESVVAQEPSATGTPEKATTPAPDESTDQPTTEAQEKATYVGTETCAGCHKAVYEKWLLTPHRRTLGEERKPELTGCESCHGPGSAHVAGGGDKSKIVNLLKLDSRQISDTCLKCHKQQEVMHFRTGPHAAAKVSCIACHNSHSTGSANMLRHVDAKQNSLQGLVAQIAEAQQQANIASRPAAKDKALAKVKSLEQKKAELTKALDSPEHRNRRASESELCLSCHKTQQAQFNQNTHHPVMEGKMECSSCHNPHGGPKGNLKAETINETCNKCHAEIEGPRVFEHPPVEEDCSICHKPHGSTNKSLLKQSEPFLCLKCHVGPHSRGGTFANGNNPTTTSRIPNYYWQCSSCHVRVHGSDRHQAFHF